MSTTRGYSVVELKTMAAGVITGTASTPELDRSGDVVDPLGISFKNPVPLLLFHDQRLPIGFVDFDTPTSKGLTFRATLPVIDEPGPLQTRVNEARQMVRAGLIRGVSIGFRALDDGIELLKSGGLKFLKTEVLELSLVAVPANSAATIAAIKSADAIQLPALSGTARVDIPTSRPGATGVTTKQARAMKVTTAEQKQTLLQTRTTKVDRLNALMDIDKGHTLDDKQQEEFDSLQSEIDAIDKHVERIDVQERLNITTATPVVAKSVDDGSKSRHLKTTVVTVTPNAAPGIAFARVVLCKMAQYLASREGRMIDVVDIARERYSHDPRVEAYLKAAVAPGTTTDATWASPLVAQPTAASEFLEFLRPQTLVGRIPGMTEVPFNARILAQTSGGAGFWVGEGKPKPLTKFDFAAQTLGRSKVAAISVISEELARFSSPSAETLVRNGLAAALTERIDIDFIDPAKAAVAGVSPASITNGVAGIPSTGNDAAAVRADLAALTQTFITNNHDPSRAVLLMPSTTALNLSIMQNDLGQSEFPGIGLQGGSLGGIPVITSQYLSRGAPNGNMVVMVNAPDIFLADDGSITVDASREAALEMDSAPTQNPPTGASLVSLWQNNLIGLRAERFIYWAKRRPEAVSWLINVLWGTSGVALAAERERES